MHPLEARVCRVFFPHDGDWEANRNGYRCPKINHLPDRLSNICHGLLGRKTAAVQMLVGW